MSSDKKTRADDRPEGAPEDPTKVRHHDPATPETEIEPGQTAKTGNAVKAKDAFGKPRLEPEWTREAIAAENMRPTMDGNDDKVMKERARKLKE